MSNVLNPLEILRDYILNNKVIPETKNETVTFGESSWPKNYETNCSITQPLVNEMQFYNLETLIHFAQNKHEFHPRYVDLARAAKITPVRRPDRKKILDYLDGVTDDINSFRSIPKKNKSQPQTPKNAPAGVSKNRPKKLSRNQRRRIKEML